MILWTRRVMLTAVFGLAGLTLLVGIGHWRAAFDLIGGEPWGRLVVGLLCLGAVALYWWPGRRGYGAAAMLAIAAGAILAHLTTLGISSAPPALALALLAGWEARLHAADFRR